VACAAIGCITLVLAIADSDGSGGAVGAAVFSEAGCAGSCLDDAELAATGGGAVEIFNESSAGRVAAGLVRTESGGTGVGVAETVRSPPGLRLDGGVDDAGARGALGIAVLSETGCADSCATGGAAVETFNESSASGVAAGLVRTESGGTLGVGADDAGASGALDAAVFSEVGCVESGLAEAALGATGGGAEAFNWSFASGGAAGLVRTESGGTLGVGADDAGAVGAAVFSEASCTDSCLDEAELGATSGDVEAFSWSFASGGAAGLVRTESGGTLGVVGGETFAATG